MVDGLWNSDKKDALFWSSIAIILLCAVGALDYLTGPELSFSLFYLIPITIMSLGVNWKFGGLMAVASAGMLLLADLASGPAYSSPFIYYWNTGICLAFFLLTVLVIRLSKTLEAEKDMARSDFVTGTYNARYFHELAQAEIQRSDRYNHPLTIVFIDIDNFKKVNDRFGHRVGDQALATVAASLRNNLRQSDIVARVGGDEFAILMPETGAEAVHAVLTKLQSNLQEEVQRHNWPITLSVGSVTFNTMPDSADEMLNIADQVMCAVKNNGKNNVRYATYPGFEFVESHFRQREMSFPK